MMRWLEMQGMDVTYCTSIDVHENGDLLWLSDGSPKYKAFLSVGHNEYWSWEMRQRIETARDRGMHLGFFGANIGYWQIRLEASSVNGAPNRTVVGYKDHYAEEAPGGDPLYSSNDPSLRRFVTVRFRDIAPLVSGLASRAEENMIGVMYGIYAVDTDVVITNPGHWVCDLAGCSSGLSLPGLLGDEIDWRNDPVGDPPPGQLSVVAQSPSNVPMDNNSAEMVSYLAFGGANVVATASYQWLWGLDDFGSGPPCQSNCRPALSNTVAKAITNNILRRFLISLKPVQTTANPGDTLSVQWTAPEDHSLGDQVGLFGVADGSQIGLQNPGAGASGTVSFMTSQMMAPGYYEFRYLTDNGLNNATTSAVVAVGLGIPLMAPSTADPGSSVTLMWRAPAGHSPNDWIGLFEVADDPNKVPGPVGAAGESWQPTGAGSCDATTCTGSLTFTMPNLAGLYEFRYFLNNGYYKVATSNGVAVNRTSHDMDASVVSGTGTAAVSWRAPAGHSGLDWIGLFMQGEPDSPARAWYYTGPAPSGLMTFRLQGKPGQYEFRYFVNDASTSTPPSVPVTSDGDNPYTLDPFPSIVYQGLSVPLTVTWMAPGTHSANDTVALFKLGALDTDPPEWRSTTGPGTENTLTAPIPGQAGLYEFRYIQSGSSLASARSGIVNVTR